MCCSVVGKMAINLDFVFEQNVIFHWIFILGSKETVQWVNKVCCEETSTTSNWTIQNHINQSCEFVINFCGHKQRYLKF